MNHDKRVLITGGSGMVGRYLKRLIPDADFPSSKNYNLLNQESTFEMILDYKPDWVIHLAARVGGILDNQKNPCDYYEENILMNTNILASCRDTGVERFTGVLSTCAYPDEVYNVHKQYDRGDVYPLRESHLHDGPPAESNFGYGIAKRALATHIDTCNKQYGTKYNYLIPCNLYGKYDKFDSSRSHYVAALIRKIYESEGKLELFGTGKPLRQFMYAGDFARIIKEMIDRDITDSFNVATPEVKTIKEIAEIAIEATREWKMDNGQWVIKEIVFDQLKPDGQYRKDVSIEKFRKYFPDFEFTSLYEGIQSTYQYCNEQWAINN